MLKETDVESALANCLALIRQINAELSAGEPFVGVSSAAEPFVGVSSAGELLFYLECAAASALKRSVSRSRKRGETKIALNYH
jgi:hypothetical protein